MMSTISGTVTHPLSNHIYMPYSTMTSLVSELSTAFISSYASFVYVCSVLFMLITIRALVPFLLFLILLPATSAVFLTKMHFQMDLR